jgi:hypothetical protein
MSTEKRKRLFVDSKIQGALVLRVTEYWISCLLVIAAMLVVWRIFTNPPRLMHTHFIDILFDYGPAVVMSLLLLPLAILDVLRLSSRFVGSFLRLRRAMHQLAQGEHVGLIGFRKGDFWQEFAEDFNAVVARLEAAEQRLGQDEAMEEETEKVTCPSSE